MSNAVPFLRDWWNRQRGDRPMPRRSELDPRALVPALPRLVILGVAPADEPSRHHFTYRLAGTKIDEGLGCGLTRKSPDETIFGDATAAIIEEYEKVVRERRPFYSELEHLPPAAGRHKMVDYACFIAPLSDEDGERVETLVAAVDFSETAMPVVVKKGGWVHRTAALWRPSAGP